MNYKESFCNRLKELKDQKGLSWEKLVYSAGLTKGVVTDLKNAKVDLKLSTILKLSSALEISPSELFNFDLDLGGLE